jgi:hypothetical protein
MKLVEPELQARAFLTEATETDSRAHGAGSPEVGAAQDVPDLGAIDRVSRRSYWGSDEVRVFCALQRLFRLALSHLRIASVPRA